MHSRLYIPFSNSYSLVSYLQYINSIEATHPIFARLVDHVHTGRFWGADIGARRARLPQTNH